MFLFSAVAVVLDVDHNFLVPMFSTLLVTDYCHRCPPPRWWSWIPFVNVLFDVDHGFPVAEVSSMSLFDSFLWMFSLMLIT